MERYTELEAKVKELARELPGITLGYIGNLERWGDDRSWYIFLPNYTGKARNTFVDVHVCDAWDWAKLEAEVRRKYARVYALSIGAWGTVVNTRTGEEFGGTIHTLRLDDPTLTPDGLLYCRPFEIADAAK